MNGASLLSSASSTHQPIRSRRVLPRFGLQSSGVVVRGARIEYRELVGQPNHEVLRALRWCDFVVDEVYSDTPMARFATEAAYFGKAAVVGSYAAALYHVREDPPLPPSLLCHPDEIEEAIMSLASDASLRGELGLRAQAFVTQQWSPADVAGRLLRLIDGAAPAEWVVQPRDLTYVHGWGDRRRRSNQPFIE